MTEVKKNYFRLITINNCLWLQCFWLKNCSEMPFFHWKNTQKILHHLQREAGLWTAFKLALISNKAYRIHGKGQGEWQDICKEFAKTPADPLHNHVASRSASLCCFYFLCFWQFLVLCFKSHNFIIIVWCYHQFTRIFNAVKDFFYSVYLNVFLFFRS